MKKSRYNIIIEHTNNSFILFNTYSQAIIELDRNFKERLENFSSNKFSAEELQSLEEYHIIVNSKANEHKEVIERYNQEKENTEILNIDILTTLKCNFNCSYCYQQALKNKPRMSNDKIIEACNWIINLRKKYKSKTLNLHLFGGEPLLEGKNTLYLCKKLFEDSKKESYQFNISLTTNGSLLSEEILNPLSEFGLNDIKITIDGPKEIHNKLRPLKNGKDSFKIIIENLKKFAPLYPIWLSVNFDNTSYPHIKKLLLALKKEKLHQYIQLIDFKPIMFTKDIPNHHEASVGFEENSIDKIIKIKNLAKKTGFKVRMYEPQRGPCGLFLKNYYAISPDGEISPCSGFVSENGFAVGDTSREPEKTKFLNTNPWQGCPDGDCKYMPLCTGGCRSSIHALNGGWDKLNCDKKYFEQTIPYYVREIFKTL